MDGPIGGRVATWLAVANTAAAVVLGAIALHDRRRIRTVGT